MTVNNEIPKEIKRWNWGAFLLTFFWSIRHGVWFGLLIFVPFFGFFVPFILGAKGNQKAWKKNKGESIESFLKRQKFWSITGISIWTFFLLIFFSSFLFTKHTMKMGLETINSNKRLSEYFGTPIKISFFNKTYKEEINSKYSNISIAFKAIGIKNSGNVYFQWEKRDGELVATDIIFVDTKNIIHRIADSPTITTSFPTKIPYKKSSLENILDRMIEEQNGYIILIRSKNNNDFIQTSINISDDGKVGFSVDYSDGYTESNKKLYQSKNLIYDKKEIIKLFSLYASGKDSHINLLQWNNLSSIQSVDKNIVHFTFGEQL